MAKIIAVITGDVIQSRKAPDKGIWLNRLKKLFEHFQHESRAEIFRGDSFQWELQKPEDALLAAFMLRARIRSEKALYDNKVDLRMGIGIGELSYVSSSVAESDGEAYHFSGHQLDDLQKSGEKISLQTKWAKLNEEMEVSLQLANAIMDDWSRNSAEIATFIFMDKKYTQTALAEKLGISQPAITKRIGRAHMGAVLSLEERFRTLVNQFNGSRAD